MRNSLLQNFAFCVMITLYKIHYWGVIYVNWKKIIGEKVVLPFLMAILLNIFFILCTIGIKKWIYEEINESILYTSSLLVSGWFLLTRYIEGTKHKFPTKPSYNMGTVQNNVMEQKTTIVIRSNKGQLDEYKEFPKIDPILIRRICFYYVYRKGKLTHTYLVDEKGFFKNKAERARFQHLLVENGLAELKNPEDVTRGIKLTEVGRETFSQLAKDYYPTSLEVRGFLTEKMAQDLNDLN